MEQKRSEIENKVVNLKEFKEAKLYKQQKLTECLITWMQYPKSLTSDALLKRIETGDPMGTRAGVTRKCQRMYRMMIGLENSKSITTFAWNIETNYKKIDPFATAFDVSFKDSPKLPEKPTILDIGIFLEELCDLYTMSSTQEGVEHAFIMFHVYAWRAGIRYYFSKPWDSEDTIETFLKCLNIMKPDENKDPNGEYIKV